MILRSEDDKAITTCLKKKTDKYTAPDIQHEILQIMAWHVLQEVLTSIQSASFLTLMMDETTDVSNKEQVVTSILSMGGW